MIYFETKKDLADVTAFLSMVREYWAIEKSIDWTSISDTSNLLLRYRELGENIARKTPNIAHISDQTGIPHAFCSYPAPAVGGPAITVCIYESILYDDAYASIPAQRKLNFINKLIGQLEEKREFELKKIINPFYWLDLTVTKILRIPFWLLSKTGFEMSKVEDHFLSKAFKLFEIVALLYISVRLGVPDEWSKSILGTIGK